MPACTAALSDRVLVVEGTARPCELAWPDVSARRVYAAVVCEGRFQGLVSLADASLSTEQRTFAELVRPQKRPVVTERTALIEAGRLLTRHDVDAIAVVSSDGMYRGTITAQSLLAALLSDEPPVVTADGTLPPAPTALERLVLQRADDLQRANRILQAEMTERFKAEAALRRSETLLRSVIDNVPAFVARLHLDGRFAFINQVVSGLTLDQVLEHHIADFVLPEHRTDVTRMLSDALATGRMQSREIPGVGPQGATAVYDLRIAPLREGDQFTGFITVATDITESKQAAEQVQYYQEIVENIQIGLYVYEVEGCAAGHTLRCLSANPASQRLTGLDAREYVGRTVDEGFPDLRQSGLVEMALNVLQTRKSLKVDDFWYGDERVPRSAWEFMIFPLTERCVGIAFENVTDRKRTEEQAHELQTELAHVARLSTMGEMASGLAHELNQPLAAIVAYADACQELVDSGRMEREQLLEVLRAVASQAERAGKIIHRLRSLVKKSRPIRNAMLVNDAVREVSALLEPEIRNRGAHLRLELEEGLPATSADFVQIQQVLLNLMRNALDSMAEVDPQQRRLAVSTRMNSEGQVEIAVRDRGRGISPENISRLFEPFFTTKAEGLGMGLPISRTIVETHGGRLWLAPNPETGMTARFVLPALDERGRNDASTDRLYRR